MFMNAEQAPSQSNKPGEKEPAVFRSETIEFRFPVSTLVEAGVLSGEAKKTETATSPMAKDKEDAQAFSEQPKKGASDATSSRPKNAADVDGWKKFSEEDRLDHWQRIFQTGKYDLYAKDRGPVKWDAFRHASYEGITDPITFVRNLGDHVKKIDYEFRGEKDIGDAKERLERVAALSGIIALFTTFDWATSKLWAVPFDKRYPVKDGKNLTAEEFKYKAKVKAFKKILEVMNDKYATVLGNMLVEKISGKRGFIHEVADKGADTINVGFDTLEDFVNGPTLESWMRIGFQVPIVGALLEQGVTRLSRFQEKSGLHTATGKMLYTALGVFLQFNIEANRVSKKGKKS